jgi:hypothetical protein
MPTSTPRYDGTVLRRAREHAGLSREQLALQADTSYQIVVHAELYRPPRVDTFVRVCWTLGIAVDDCFVADR